VPRRGGAGHHAAPVRVTTPGDPCEVLCEHARSARLVVLGNPQQSALAAALTGSTALRCLHHAECPIVLVPEPG